MEGPWMEGNEIEDGLYGNDVSLNPQESSFIEEWKNNSLCSTIEH